MRVRPVDPHPPNSHLIQWMHAVSGRGEPERTSGGRTWTWTAWWQRGHHVRLGGRGCGRLSTHCRHRVTHPLPQSNHVHSLPRTDRTSKRADVVDRCLLASSSRGWGIYSYINQSVLVMGVGSQIMPWNFSLSVFSATVPKPGSNGHHNKSLTFFLMVK